MNVGNMTVGIQNSPVEILIQSISWRGHHLVDHLARSPRHIRGCVLAWRGGLVSHLMSAPSPFRSNGSRCLTMLSWKFSLSSILNSKILIINFLLNQLMKKISTQFSFPNFHSLDKHILVLRYISYLKLELSLLLKNHLDKSYT